MLELACMASVPVRANRNRAARKSFFALERRKQLWGAKKTSIGKGGGGGKKGKLACFPRYKFIQKRISAIREITNGFRQMYLWKSSEMTNQGRKTSGWLLHWKKNFLCSERESNPRPGVITITLSEKPCWLHG